MKPTELTKDQAVTCFELAFGKGFDSEKIQIEPMQDMLVLSIEIAPQTRRILHLYDNGSMASMTVHSDVMVYPVPANAKAVIRYIDGLISPTHDYSPQLWG